MGGVPVYFFVLFKKKKKEQSMNKVKVRLTVININILMVVTKNNVSSLQIHVPESAQR